MHREIRSRRFFLGSLVTAAAGLASVACQSAAPAQPKSTEAPTTAPAKPAAPAAPAATPAAAPPAATAASPAAAGPAASPAAAAPQASPAVVGPASVVNVGVGNSVQNTPFFIGAEKGIFLKYGADVKLKQLNTGAEITKALQTGELQVGPASFNNHIAAEAQDIHFTGFALMVNDAVVENNDNLFAIIAQPNSSVNAIADIRGKTVGTTAATSQDVYFREVLKRAGVPVDSVQFTNAPPQNMVSAFASGQEVVVTTEPFGEIIMKQYPNAKLLQRGGGIVGQRAGVTASKEWLTKNPALADAVVAGLVESSFVTRTQPVAVGEAVPRWFSGIDAQTSIKSVSHLAFDPRYSQLVEDAWKKEGQLLIDQKKIKEQIPFNTVFDMKYFTDLPKKYAQFFTDLKPLP